MVLTVSFWLRMLFVRAYRLVNIRRKLMCNFLQFIGKYCQCKRTSRHVFNETENKDIKREKHFSVLQVRIILVMKMFRCRAVYIWYFAIPERGSSGSWKKMLWHLKVNDSHLKMSRPGIKGTS